MSNIHKEEETWARALKEQLVQCGITDTAVINEAVIAERARLVADRFARLQLHEREGTPLTFGIQYRPTPTLDTTVVGGDLVYRDERPSAFRNRASSPPSTPVPP